jgi:16S rRNA (cytosine1407-C5)-methyltransferase
MEAFATKKIASFRVNTLKALDPFVLQSLAQLGIPVEPLSLIPGVYFLDRSHEYALKGTNLFREGYIYMQSLSSLLPALILNPQAGEKILDVCSAPGSKTTQIAAMTGNKAEIVALEQNQIRYDKLIHNIALQNAKCVTTHKTEAKKFLNESEEEYDAILLDVPCSAEGRISLEDEKTFGFFSIDNIQKKAELQKELITTAFLRLKRGGRMVYSTCTLSPEENEGVLQSLITAFPQAKIVTAYLPEFEELRKGLSEFGDTKYDVSMKNAVRILPSGRFEGFFMARIIKV